MSLLKKTRGAQWPLVAEFDFNFDDTMANTTGATTDFKSVATVAVDAIPLPPNATVLGGDILVLTAYAGPTAATVSVGDSASATKYANAVDLKTAARTALTLPDAVDTDGLDVRLTVTNTVAAATAGKVRVRVMYTVDGRVNEVLAS